MDKNKFNGYMHKAKVALVWAAIVGIVAATLSVGYFIYSIATVV